MGRTSLMTMGCTVDLGFRSHDDRHRSHDDHDVWVRRLVVPSEPTRIGFRRLRANPGRGRARTGGTKTVLLREVHHRVKNNLQIVSSLLNIGDTDSTTDGSDRRTLSSVEQRVRAMALVHEHLYQKEDLAFIDLRVYLRDLGEGLNNPILGGTRSVAVRRSGYEGLSER